MWKTSQPPLDTRILVSAKRKVWIGRRRHKWDWRTKTYSDEFEWSLEGKTVAQTADWVIDGWQEIPEAIGAPKPWKPASYLDTLELSVRSNNALRMAGLTSKKQIMALSRDDLLALKNVGVGTADEIIERRAFPNPDYAKLLDEA